MSTDICGRRPGELVACEPTIICCKKLPGRIVATLSIMAFTIRLNVEYELDSGYFDCWCYHDRESAIAALEKWDGIGEPEGWHRSPMTGRRRPGGDPNQEYVNW